MCCRALTSRPRVTDSSRLMFMVTCLSPMRGRTSASLAPLRTCRLSCCSPPGREVTFNWRVGVQSTRCRAGDESQAAVAPWQGLLRTWQIGKWAGALAERAEVGQGTHKKRAWFHGKGRTGIRSKYYSHLWVSPGAPEKQALSPIACIATSCATLLLLLFMRQHLHLRFAGELSPLTCQRSSCQHQCAPSEHLQLPDSQCGGRIARDEAERTHTSRGGKTRLVKSLA